MCDPVSSGEHLRRKCRYENHTVDTLWTLKNLVFLRKTLNVLFMYLDTHMLSAPITTKVVTSNTAHGGVYSIQHYVIKFISDLRQTTGLWFFLGTLVFSTIKTDRQDLSEILLKVALNTKTLTHISEMCKSNCDEHYRHHCPQIIWQN